MKFKINLLLLLLLLSNKISAQGVLKALKVGDSVGNHIISKFINFDKQKVKLYDFKKDLIILDFWNTGCKSCIEAMPRMEALEKKFHSKLKILPITNQKQGTIREFWSRNKYLKNLKSLSVVEDRIFESLFPHLYYPHDVWIYKGKVVAVTSLEYVDEYNISEILKDKQINWAVKNDYYRFDSKVPIFHVKDYLKNGPVYYSALSDYKENFSYGGLSGGWSITRDSVNSTIRANFINQPILNTFVTEIDAIINKDTLIKPNPGFELNQVLWDVNDRRPYVFEKSIGQYSQEWLRKNGICGEFVYHDTGQSDIEVHKNMIADLERLLGLKVYWKAISEQVYTVTKNKEVLKGHKIRKGEWYDLYTIIHNMNQTAGNPYIFNESGDELTQIKVDAESWGDINYIKKILSENGFALNSQERIVHKLLFSEIDGGRIVDDELQKTASTRKKYTDSLIATNPGSNTNIVDNKLLVDYQSVTSSGLRYKVIRQGIGKSPTISDKVNVHYECSLLNGKIFDSTYSNGIPSEIQINETLPGFSEALLKMQEGAIWEILLPPGLAYGTHTAQGRIPANSTLICKIQLVKILP
jgi:FKBP-type peptidyl-prolyl cis-trans isomerase/thiol-disulfide isomerase/thioredoxin